MADTWKLQFTHLLGGRGELAIPRITSQRKRSWPGPTMNTNVLVSVFCGSPLLFDFKGKDTKSEPYNQLPCNPLG